MSSQTEILTLLAYLNSLKNADAFMGANATEKCMGFVMVLEPFSLPVLRAAVKACLETEEWFPSPATLKRLCEREVYRLAAPRVAEIAAFRLPAETVKRFDSLDPLARRRALIAAWGEETGVDWLQWEACMSAEARAEMLPEWAEMMPGRLDAPLIADSIIERLGGEQA